MTKIEVLSHAWESLATISKCRPRVGLEIEFYLASDRTTRADLIRLCDVAIGKNAIEAEPIRSEIGRCQYELSIKPQWHPRAIVTAIEYSKSLISDVLRLCGAEALFGARPYRLEPPSALHINVSLVDGKGQNHFAEGVGIVGYQPLLKESIAGVCEVMNGSMPFFTPDEMSFERFRLQFLGGPYRYANAPTTISWGGNNRTVAIRVPPSTCDPMARRLEHRVPCSNADPSLAIACVLIGMGQGIQQRMPLNIMKEHGHADDPLGQRRLATTMASAMSAYLTCDVISSKIPIGLNAMAIGAGSDARHR